MSDRSLDPATLAIHADKGLEDAADVAPPLHMSTTFDRAADQDGPVYIRDPEVVTRRRLEAVLGALDGGEAVTFASGMAAIAAVVQVLAPRRLLLPDEVYHGTRAWAEAEAAAGRLVLGTHREIGAGDLLWVETPSNPKCLVTDIDATAARARAAGAKLVVDGTFATPILQQPLSLGADVVMHSTTKAIAGHSDAVGGVLVTADRNLADDLQQFRARGGAVPGSLETWLTLRGVRTLDVRVRRASETAAQIARELAGRGLQVWYPFLSGHPDAGIARRQMAFGGGILSIELDSYSAAARVMHSLRIFAVATSLGGVESLAEHRRTVDLAAPEGLIRLSMGLEAADDLMNDLLGALDQTDD